MGRELFSLSIFYVIIIVEIQNKIHDIVFSYEGIIQILELYIDKETKTISFDIILDFKLKNRDEVLKSIYDEVQKEYNDYKINIILDFDISD